MNVLIIGSKGFIGSHIYDGLINEPSIKSVVSCDVLHDYNTENYYVIDVTNTDFSSIFQKHEFDFCINCSGAASVPDSLKNPLRDFQLNTVNVYKILDAIKSYAPNCRFINFSSAAVYGNPLKLPISENSDLKPLSPYGMHKLYSEEICQQFSNYYNIDTCSLRVFSAYGCGLKKQLFWDLYNKLNFDNSISLWGTGHESRDFIEVRDIVQIVKLIMKTPKFEYSVLNVANGVEIKIQDVVKLFFNKLGKDVIVKFNGEIREGDPQNWCANIEYLKSIGYSKTIDIEDGLKDYCEWLKKLMNEKE